ncbi:S53 family peptidase [Paraburkholderia phosphatilytica]|uniref:S53 family peptidase n=1 Tax=Paraburkholderia phosphatilytica TaxID=2282883 RepID=UPI000E4892D4|nr:S53 family peptidase [Paraburkholderia phosphatilytica]
MTKHPLAGSERAVAQGSKPLGQCDPAQSIEVVVMLRRRDEASFQAFAKQIGAGDPAAKPLSREAFAQRFGAAPEDVAKLQSFANAQGLKIVRSDTGARSVVLSGTVAQFQDAFGVRLEHFEHHQLGRYRTHAGPVQVPDDIHDAVTAVLGLDDRPQAQPHFRIRPPMRAAQAAQVSYTPVQLASLYQFPAGDGKGQCVGIVELGGGYNTSDLKQYFSQLGVSEPKVVPVSVDQGSNQPTGDPNGPDGEVTLDIEIVGAIAPAATIAVYFTQNGEAGFVDAVSQAVHDTTNKPSVISISWGAPESSWPAQSLQAFNAALQDAATLGVTVCAAAGDSGSSDGATDGQNHVDFPASSPYVLACGGTNLHASGASISRETVWNDGEQGGATGGGISGTFAVPAWQEGLSAALTSGGKTKLTKRGVPDVAADASPETGYTVLIDGQQTVVGGTSAVAPLWAALIARINAAKGQSVGFINAKLYAASGVCNDITQGNNGSYAAASGWDACTGLGSPDGAKVSAAL